MFAILIAFLGAIFEKLVVDFERFIVRFGDVFEKIFGFYAENRSCFQGYFLALVLVGEEPGVHGETCFNSFVFHCGTNGGRTSK